MTNKYLYLRRFSQFIILFLYFGANVWGWNILMGNLSSSKLFETIPLADPFALLQILATGTLVSIDLIIGALIIVLFYAIFGGRAFCSWVCPVNLVTDLANWSRRKLNITGDRKLFLSRNLRFYLIGLTLIVSAISGLTAFEYISPISIFTREIIFGIGMGWGVVLSIFLFDLFVVKNGWCGHICPLGAFYSLIGKFSIFKVKYDLNKCTNCMQCKVVCPEKDVLNMVGKNSSFVSDKECTLCGRCIDVCNDKALEFHINNIINYGEKK